MNLTSDYIKELSDIKINHSVKIFYLWMLLRFDGKDPYIQELEEFRSRRQIFRYLDVLEEYGMIKRYRASLNEISQRPVKVQILELG